MVTVSPISGGGKRDISAVFPAEPEKVWILQRNRKTKGCDSREPIFYFQHLRFFGGKSKPLDEWYMIFNKCLSNNGKSRQKMLGGL